MKRAIIPEQPLPTSLTALQKHLHSQHVPSTKLARDCKIGWNSSDLNSYTGPTAAVEKGDYVAVYVQELAGTSTLISQPLAKTTIREFVDVFGSTTPNAAALSACLLPS